MSKKCAVEKLCSTEFRHLVVIQQRAVTKDEIGGQTVVWSTFTSPWVKAEPTGGSQRMFAGKIDNPAGMKFTMRYVAGVTETMRVLWGTRTFDIKNVLNVDERNIYLVLKTEERVGT